MNPIAAAFFDSTAFRFLLVGLSATAAAAIGIAITFVLSKRFGSIERRLAGYEPLGNSDAARPMSQHDVFDLSSDSKVVTNAVDKTRELAERAGVLTKVELFLEQANVPMRPAACDRASGPGSGFRSAGRVGKSGAAQVAGRPVRSGR